MSKLLTDVGVWAMKCGGTDEVAFGETLCGETRRWYLARFKMMYRAW